MTMFVLAQHIVTVGERFGGPQDRLLDTRSGHNSSPGGGPRAGSHTRKLNHEHPLQLPIHTRLGNDAKNLTAAERPILRAKQSFSAELFADYVRQETTTSPPASAAQVFSTVERRKLIFP